MYPNSNSRMINKSYKVEEKQRKENNERGKGRKEGKK